MFNDVQLGFTSLVVAIFFSTGMILLSLGIIGEYIRRIWVSQHSLDRVIVAEKWRHEAEGYGISLESLTAETAEWVRRWRNHPRIRQQMEYREIISPRMQER